MALYGAAVAERKIVPQATRRAGQYTSVETSHGYRYRYRGSPGEGARCVNFSLTAGAVTLAPYGDSHA